MRARTACTTILEDARQSLNHFNGISQPSQRVRLTPQIYIPQSVSAMAILVVPHSSGPLPLRRRQLTCCSVAWCARLAFQHRLLSINSGKYAFSMSQPTYSSIYDPPHFTVVNVSISQDHWKQSLCAPHPFDLRPLCTVCLRNGTVLEAYRLYFRPMGRGRYCQPQRQSPVTLRSHRCHRWDQSGYLYAAEACRLRNTWRLEKS